MACKVDVSRIRLVGDDESNGANADSGNWLKHRILSEVGKPLPNVATTASKTAKWRATCITGCLRCHQRNKRCGYSAGRMAEAFQARGLVMPKASLVTLSVHVVGRLLANGGYITAFPSSWVHVNALKILPVDLPVRPWPVVILTLKNRTQNPVVERFIEHMREAVKSLPKPGSRTAHPPKSDGRGRGGHR